MTSGGTSSWTGAIGDSSHVPPTAVTGLRSGALHLIPGIPYPGRLPNQQLNGNSSVTPWPDANTKYFLVETPRVPTNRPISNSVEFVSNDPIDVSLNVAEWDKPNPPVVVDDSGAGATPRSLEWRGDPAGRS